jgi:putative ABC transport system permease protein
MTRFPLRLALWEGRNSIRSVGLYMLSISLGVAALVSVHSFRADVARSVAQEAQVLLGADIVMRANRPLPDSVTSILDSLTAAGHETSAAITVPSMVLAPRTDLVRLLQVRGVEGGWPLYGEVVTEPAGVWGTHLDEGTALVDPAVLTQLGVDVGDSLRVGSRSVVIAGTVRDLPTDIGFQAAVGPRVYLSLAELEASELLGFGSVARYVRFLRVPDARDREILEERYEAVLEATSVGFRTAEENSEDLTDAVGFLGRFLGLVGLGALLLGGIGVGSAIHVFVKDRLTEVAILRCIGARQGSVFLAYLLQAGGMGILGAALGAVAGVVIQQLLPGLLAGVLPVDVDPRISWWTVLGGIGIGLWVSVVFALLPLLGVRDVPPLRALRQDFEVGSRRRDVLRIVAVLALGASVLALSILEAPEPEAGIGFAVALGFTTFLLWGTGFLVIRAARRFFPARAPYVIRQGFSNLFRPQNQTVSVILALGFGAFVVGTILQVQGSLARNLSFEAEAGRPNLLMFDIQSDQLDGVEALISGGHEGEVVETTALVPSRMVAINGLDRRALEELPEEERPDRWAIRREYRHTSRALLTSAEELLEGAWWPEAPPVEPGVARISMDVDLASSLRIGVGDRITWDVAGVRLESEVSSLRRIDWQRFQTNFFVVFEPGALDAAPATFVTLARIDGEEARGRFQRDLVESFPNVSVLDVARIQETLETILGRVDQAIRFLAVFAAFAGLLVLAGALATSRQQRQREGALLKTLGARRKQVLAVLLTEYVSLGTLAAATGLILALMASGALVTWVFDLDFVPRLDTLVAIWVGISALTVLTGAVGSRDLLRKPPLPILRGE